MIQPRAVAPKSVRPAEAAVLLGVCRDTVYVLMRSGRPRSIKAGRARLIPLAAIDEFLSADEEFAAWWAIVVGLTGKARCTSSGRACGLR